MVDDRIEVYDFVKQQLYTLQDRGKYDYTLSEENGTLIVTVTNDRTKNIVGKGPLALEKDGSSYRLTYREYVLSDNS